MLKDIDSFLYQNNHYRGHFKPEHLLFNANLQEFTQRVGFLCNLETAGKITPENCYEQIQDLWQNFKIINKKLGIGEPKSARSDL
jgi:hypothetical protein